MTATQSGVRLTPAFALEWRDTLPGWAGQYQDGPFILDIVATQLELVWRVVLRDCAGRAEFMRADLELQGEPDEVREKLLEMGEQWKRDPSLVFDGWGKT